MHFLWIRIRAPTPGYRLFLIWIPRDGSTGPGGSFYFNFCSYYCPGRNRSLQSSHNIVLIPGLWIHIRYRMDPHPIKKLDSNPGSESASKSKGRSCSEAQNVAMKDSGRSQGSVEAQNGVLEGLMTSGQRFASLWMSLMRSRVQIRICIKVKTRICIKVKRRIRIHLRVMRIRKTAILLNLFTCGPKVGCISQRKESPTG